MSKWRLLDFHVDNAAMQMAIDEAIMEAVRLKKVPNTIRFFQIIPAMVTIGCHQKSADMKQNFVRRLTGGGAVFHDHDLTYAFIFREEDKLSDFQQSYYFVGACLIKGFLENGMAVDYSQKKYQKNSEYCAFNENNYDLVLNNKKIAGNALVQSRGVFLQQGVIFGYSDDEFREKMILGIKKQLAKLKISLENQVLSQFEKELAHKIYQEKYQCERWNKRI